MPSLLPDPAELRALAGRIDSHARAMRARADRLGWLVAAASWHGLAASTFDRQVELTLRGLRGAAGRLEDAADALRRHADNIARVIDTLVAIVQLGLGTMEELLSRPVEVLHTVASAVGDVTDSTLRLVGL